MNNQNTNQPTPQVPAAPPADWMEEEVEGQLAVDVYQTADDVVIKAPIAGVAPSDLEIAITDEVVSVKGSRKQNMQVERESYFVQECYWGGFSRTYTLPVAVSSEKATALLKNGILTITIPKSEKTKTKLVDIKTE